MERTSGSLYSLSEQSYDFVIAGGGIAGLTLADRLTENPAIKVLVIEAGPFDGGAGIDVPGEWDPTPYLWPGLTTEPLTALNNRSENVVCGRVVGGGSTANAMNWLRGHSADFDAFEALGNPGWNWESILEYSKKSENFTAPDADFAAANGIHFDLSARGTEGPVQTSFANYYYPGNTNFRDAAASVGIPVVDDPNDGTFNSGVYWLTTVLDQQTLTRCSARVAHYDRVIDGRPNYHILTDTTVSKVLFNGTTAVGVEYLPSAGGNTSTVLASKEVIVAAGALHTPQLLQLSGIGPKKLLENLGIPVVSNLPGVGSNLQDQTTFNIPYNFTNPITPNVDTFITNTTYNAEQRALYDARQPSAYTMVQHVNPLFAGVSLPDALPAADFTALLESALAHPAASSLPADTDPTVLAGYEAQRAAIFQQFNNTKLAVSILSWDTFSTASVFHMKPLSRGTVAISSLNPLAPPTIDYRSATDPLDIDINVLMARKLRQLMAAPSMAGALGAVELAPFGEDVQSDAEIIAVARETMSVSNAHQCCTAPMLPRELGGVVDAQRKVYGVKALRTGDVSYLPFSLSGAPTAATYASVEKLADMIKEEWGI
ncbi:hypothetical protein B0J18DRAFT_448056 [Chaetomium sp. MPI-SDFR-AT-0129]|nr:hypothetical protein B0J18DRAFT_448056 [Chaetomium sp. MPI-SDFR-AT-0129]